MKDFIGVFDSGVGGLTVLDAIVDLLPNENYYYVADQGHVPYGTKPQSYVGDRVEKICKHMESLGAKAVVIACNTASLQIARGQAVCSIPIISVIYPTADRAVSLTKNKKVAVLATSATINSRTYHKLLEEKGCEVVGLPCDSFVKFVESGNTNKDEELAVVKERLDNIKDQEFDTLIHGCTHFSLLQESMKKIIGEKNYVACGLPTGEKLKTILEEKNLLNKEAGEKTIEVYTTGTVEGAVNSMKWFKKDHKPVQHIDIE